MRSIPVTDVKIGDELVNLGVVEDLEGWIPDTVTVVTRDQFKNRGRFYIPNDQEMVLV